MGMRERIYGAIMRNMDGARRIPRMWQGAIAPQSVENLSALPTNMESISLPTRGDERNKGGIARRAAFA